jgi:hypothetical protein
MLLPFSLSQLSNLSSAQIIKNRFAILKITLQDELPHLGKLLHKYRNQYIRQR